MGVWSKGKTNKGVGSGGSEGDRKVGGGSLRSRRGFFRLGSRCRDRVNRFSLRRRRKFGSSGRNGYRRGRDNGVWFRFERCFFRFRIRRRCNDRFRGSFSWGRK